MSTKPQTSLLLIVIGWATVVSIVWGQTKSDATTQLKNLTVSPIAGIQRWQCVGSGTHTDGTKWDCNGLQKITITFTDGTVRGPYILTPATTTQDTLPLWQPVPLEAPDPVIP